MALSNAEKHQRRRAKRRLHIEQAKSKPCADCGQFLPWYVMEFDHVEERGPKLFVVGGGNRALGKLQAEIEKCDVVCANCHKIRTHEREVLRQATVRAL